MTDMKDRILIKNKREPIFPNSGMTTIPPNGYKSTAPAEPPIAYVPVPPQLSQ
jgi:hypothetical protein